MNIVIEKNIPFVAGLLDGLAHVDYLSAEEITPEAMSNADALLTRTRTRCDAALLDGSRCQMIATATIGTDHIDLDYCRCRGIAVANAPGCNAPAVAQYVMSSIINWLTDNHSPFQRVVVGVVGVGHVGSIVARWAEALGCQVLRVDPPRAAAEGPEGFCTLQQVAREANIITFHTPLTYDGPDATYHLANERFFTSLRQRPLIINSSRGAVVDTQAILAAHRRGLIYDSVIDCWEGEPDISPQLLAQSVYATPHIAGYSRQGKIRASVMALDALTSHFGLPRVLPPEAAEVDYPVPDSPTAAALTATYDPRPLTEALHRAGRDAERGTGPGLAAAFEAMRNSYAYRSEPR